MQSTSEGFLDVLDLARELRSEKLFVQAELESLRALNERLENSALQLAQAAWSSTQQRSHLRQLFALGDLGNTGCCQRTDFVLSPVFVDAHKVLRYQDALVLSEVIGRVRACPAVASLWLAAAEAGRPATAAAVARALCSGLHAGAGAPRAAAALRRVLKHLARHRLATAPDPRKTIVQGSSSFSRLYCELVEGSRPARLFLAAALRAPLLPLLQLDEYLLVDPDKAMDRIKKYCSTNSSSSECQQKLVRYRKWTVSSLATAAARFVSSLSENWACFPPTIAWVVRQTALALRAARRIPEEDIHCICTDLVFTNFICQAIANPEAYGITDIPITNVGRFNLVQVAQTLQMLCLMKYQDVGGKLRDLYSKLEKDSVYSLLDMLLEDESYSAVADDDDQETGQNGDLGEGLMEGVACDVTDGELLKTEPIVNANVALFTRNDLQLLISLLKNISSTTNGFDSSPELPSTSHSVTNLERDFQELGVYDKPGTDTACGVTPPGGPAPVVEDGPRAEGLAPLLASVPPEHVARLQKLLKRLPDHNFTKESPDLRPSKGKHDGTNGNSLSPVKNSNKKNADKTPQLSQEVLVIKLPGDNNYEPIGMVPEGKVLECQYTGMGRRTLSEELLQQTAEPELLALPAEAAMGSSAATQAPGPMKRTRFSLSHDEGSIGNTSDNLEAVSEAASNHSVTSSLEMETEDQNDNLSDMVSANVSGRGSPNISGRDTPSSQVTEGDASGLAMPQAQRHPASAPLSSTAASKQAKLLKRTRNDIEDKFCKFEIKKLLEGDETISIISDTWSTDVLASDSETIGESSYDRSFAASGMAHGQQNVLVAVAGQQALPLVAPPPPDASETASESAWSTDALVSDSDRMTEVDMDDCNSVARSDTGTARSEGDASTPQLPAVALPHHQFSPLNNIKRDALLNQRQMSAASSAHTAHPDNMPQPPSGDLASAEVFHSNHDSVDSTVDMHNSSGRGADLSPLYMATGNITHCDRMQRQESRAAYQEVVRELDDNSRHVNGYAMPSCFSSPAGPSRGAPLDSPLSALDSPASYRPFPERPTLDLSAFNFPQGLNEGINHRALDSEVSTPDMYHSSNSPFVQAMSNGNATSRWLNDPSQRFPIRPDAGETPSGNGPSCSNRENLHSADTLNNSESVFRPIRVDGNLSDIDDSGIENPDPNEGCPMMAFINGSDDLSNQDLSGTLSSENSFHAPNMSNGYGDRFPNNILNRRSMEFNANPLESPSDSPLVTRLHSTSIMTTQHSFTSPNLVSNTISRVLKTTESRTSIINISSSRIEKSGNKSGDTKTDSLLNGVSSGSAISLSTLSVNSADTSTSDRSSSQDVNSENLTERRVTPPLGHVSILSSTEVKAHRVPVGNNGANTLPRNSSTPCTALMKPGASTGAIPKSISFDATAEKSHRYHSGRRGTDDSGEGSGLNFGDLKNNMKRSGGNFFNKIFRNRSRGFAASGSGFVGKRTNQEYAEDMKVSGDSELDSNGLGITSSEEPCPGPVNIKSNAELSDDILAKYRRKASSSSDAATSDSTSHSGHSGPRSRGANTEDNANVSDGESNHDRHSDAANDAEFESLKRKLRLVLSNMDVTSMELSSARSGSAALACALRLDGSGSSLSALTVLAGPRAPLAALRADAAARRPYLAYLQRCRRALLAAISALDSETEWQRAEALRQAALVAAARARVSLAAREPRLAALQERLRGGLADEKRDTLQATLNTLVRDMAAEDAWAGASEWELEQAALTVERAVMGRVYLQAMFPNGDGDVLRDQLLHDHITQLSSGGVGLPERRLAGAPWAPAQRILAHLSAYKTPRDKVECIVRCLNSIMTLLSMASEGSAPGADDLTPVLVYVLIKVNPQSLLSTVQFVSTFLSTPLEGEQLYCWTQFCSAVEFIKTMDYTRPSRR